MDAPDREPLTMSLREAAALIGVGAEWLRQQAADGVVPHRRFGRRVRFTRDDVDRIIESAANGTTRDNPWGLTARSLQYRRRGRA